MGPKIPTYTYKLSKLKCTSRDNAINYKLFSGTLRRVAMQWFSCLPPRTIHTFNNLASTFVSQFVADHAKRLEVTDLFDIRQAKGESLKKYLTHFNSATVQVNNLDQKKFREGLPKGRPTSMGEIRGRVEKHFEAEEDQVNGIHAKRNVPAISSKIDCAHSGKAHHCQGGRPNAVMTQFTPLKVERDQILIEVYHTQLLDIPPPTGRRLGSAQDEQCEFYCAHGHTT
ncbi:hypothetical protein CR513_41880, partial [Mucuna pruriens]